MTNEQFKEQITRLINTYSERQYPPERIKGIYKALKHVSYEAFKEAVTDLITDSLYAPMLSKLREACVKHEEVQRRKVKERIREDVATHNCKTCKNTGAVFAEKDNVTYAFRCPCKIGTFENFNWPLWVENEYEYTYLEMPYPRDRPRNERRNRGFRPTR